MLEIPKKLHSDIYSTALIICAFALPLSVFLISLSQIILLVNWLLEEPLKVRWKKIKTCKPLWFLSLFYLIHLLGLIPTTDFGFAFHDLHIKLPFLVIPLIVGTSNPISFCWLKRILYSFIAGVFISSIYSTFKIFTTAGDIMSQMRVISPFVWHIRLALMAVFATFILPWLFKKEKKAVVRTIYIGLLIWFVIFLFILQSLTGIFVFFILSSFLTAVAIYKMKNFMLRWFLTLLGISLILVSSSYLIHQYTRNFAPLSIKINSLEKYTVNGNAYQHQINPPYLENGNYVNLYVCKAEMEREWKKISKIDIDSASTDGHIIRYTLMRYLTSKGLRKDSAGITQLSANDIKNIEMGIANSIYTQKAGLNSRLYRLMWELYHYSIGANPSGYSVALRIEYLKTTFKIIDRNFWFGTGTGDVLKEFYAQYQMDHSPITQQWRLRAHNQMLTFLLTFGIFGFILISLSIFIPPYIKGKYKNYLFALFFAIFVLSMLTDDTLETQAGISFISLFYSVLLFFEKQAIDILEEKNPG
jgi:hypothetical protein